MPDLGQPVATGPIIAIEGTLVGPEEVRAAHPGARDDRRRAQRRQALMRGVPGTSCKLSMLSWDGPLAVEGDFLRTRHGTCYLIEEVKLARPGSQKVATFVCTRLEKDAVQDGEDGVHPIEWTPRNRTRP